jgi:hypothetical protein
MKYPRKIRTLFICLFGTMACTATALATTLAEEAKSPGNVESITSTKQDPIGVAGLPGLVGAFVVNSSCADAHRVISDIEKYPERIEKVKEVVVIKREPEALVVKYTEGAMGISSTTKMRWRFTGEPALSVSSLVVGEGESPSYTMLRFQPTQDPAYCRLNVTVFADVSWLPSFAVSWIMDASREELASTYREIVRLGLTK